MRESKALKLDSKRLKRIKDLDRDLWWMDVKHKLLRPFNRFVAFLDQVKHVLSWLPVLWRDRDWDESYMYRILAFKLRKMHYHLKHEGHAVHEKEDLDALLTMAKACDRLQSDWEYEEPYRKIHDKKWGKLKSRTEPADLDEKGKPLTYSWISWRTKTKTEAQKKQERIESRRIYEKAEMDRQSDIDVLHRILVEHSRKWWD